MDSCLLMTTLAVLGFGNPARQEWLAHPDNLSARANAQVMPVVVEHCDAQRSAGWSMASTAHFRILHTQSRELACKVAETAERTRAATFEKWFGEIPAAPECQCDIYLHATAIDYAKMTGVPETVPGHSTFRFDNGRLVSRRIDLHCDFPSMQSAVLPHEVTHAVLHGMFGEKSLPRWANEGMAALAEPTQQLHDQFEQLARFRQAGQLFALQTLMETREYPERRVAAFYAQSVSVVSFLTAARGPREFTRFVRETTELGFEKALEHRYGWTFADLERHWVASAFGKDVQLTQAQ
jgi:hypothetical protein